MLTLITPPDHYYGCDFHILCVGLYNEDIEAITEILQDVKTDVSISVATTEYNWIVKEVSHSDLILLDADVFTHPVTGWLIGKQHCYYKGGDSIFLSINHRQVSNFMQPLSTIFGGKQ